MPRKNVSLEAATRAARLAVVGCALAGAMLVTAAIMAGLPPLGVVAATALALLWVSWSS